jgi:predicted nuclease with TOPRIM domain
MSETDLLMSAFKQGYNEAKEQTCERIAELEKREKHLEEMFHGWRDEARKAYARIAELERENRRVKNIIYAYEAVRAALKGEK